MRTIVLGLLVCVCGVGQNREDIDRLFGWSGNRTGVFDAAVDYRPSFGLPSQLTIRIEGSEAVLHYLKIPESARTAYERGSLVASNAERLIPLVEVERRLTAPETEKLLEAFWEALADGTQSAKEKYGFVQLDGTSYEVRYVTGMVRGSVTELDSEIDSTNVTGKSAMVRWLNELRLDMEKRLR